MSVDLSVTIGVGFVIEDAVWNKWTQKVDPEDEYGYCEEYLKFLPDSITNVIGLGEAGSYFSGDVAVYATVPRLTEHYYSRELPGGIFGVDRPLLRLEERVAINELAAILGQKVAEPHQFVGILWS